MFRLSRQVDYALQLLAALHRLGEGQFLSIKSFSEESNISFLFLQKIVRQLRQANLVQSARGSQGGYRLRQPLEEVRFMDVVAAVEGQCGITTCARGEVCVRQEYCRIQTGIQRMNTNLMQYLEQLFVADIVGEKV